MAAPKNNNNAEKWTLDLAKELFCDALRLSKNKEIDFIGEIARELDVYRDVFVYLKDKFPELSDDYKIILSNCEANCFSHGKKGEITPSLAIMNLKSNHGWTDRIDQTTKDKELTTTTIVNLGNGINPNETTN